MCTTITSTSPSPISHFHQTTMMFQFIILSILVLTSKMFVFAFLNNDTDQQALLSFKASIEDNPLGVLASWNSSIHFCHWTGVTCSHRRERVTSLNLTSQNLVGTLSPHIGNLSFLREIYLYENNFHGSIPNEIGRLFRLQHLYLNNNSFQGGFPPNLSHCVDIRKIFMYNNNLRGKLPTEFASWTKLEVIDLGKNHFTGSIPPSIGNMSSLGILYLDRNNLAGIPLEIAHLAKLEVLYLDSNNFSDFGSSLPKLQEFNCGGNKISGLLPPSIANASGLILFDIAGNNITGPVPNNLGSLPHLQILNLNHNPLGDNMGPDDLGFFNSFVNCTNLQQLGLEETGLRGKLPNSIVNLSISMERLYLNKNHIYGSIPREIGKLENMKVLSLFDNLLTGTIPESIGKLSKLGALDLQKNNISGVIPTAISNISQLSDLYFSNNKLQGNLPTELFNISTIQYMLIANNRLSGVIPKEIGFSSQCIGLDLSRNLFTGPLPSNIGRLKHLGTLDLSYNKLTGDIPATLDGCVMLEELYLEGNLFQGRIPSSFKALKNLAFLDLSNNNISGSIPNFFVGFPLIVFLNLSHNKLGGEVSREGLFSNSSAFSVVGNLELCGGIQALHLPACPVKVSRNKKKTSAMRIKLLLILILVPFGILLVCLALIFYRRRNSKKLNNPVLLTDHQYPQLSYQDLLLATNEFSPKNLLGKGRYGSVYKGVLESVEHIVAVKVLHIEIRGANKSFLAECETLRNIRHRNLLKIITACSTIDFKGNDFKALVFEFMTNGSVDNWLHPSPYEEYERNLTLVQRLNISIDVALAVDYLHHHSHASIIHSDIKPSNILLDEDFVAHIGDFGLARFSYATMDDTNQPKMSLSTGVRGTVGYVPPEYGMGGELSLQGDVYSYGILLLEIFSGKRPTEDSILVDGGSNLHNYVRKALPERVMDIADPCMVVDQEEHGLTGNQSYNKTAMEVCLASIFEVGILCSEVMPQKRIDISVALKQLQAAKDIFLNRRQQPG
ncbi:uncharacterized protein LOC141671475 isoform X2 [Apium graveolens]|uniref:uncharacterized protein LOC141671475 isoform X2 n=1 Tax=Apium graveolens TaxID=4045 RepID=UPI003D78E1A0